MIFYDFQFQQLVKIPLQKTHLIQFKTESTQDSSADENLSTQYLSLAVLILDLFFKIQALSFCI